MLRFSVLAATRSLACTLPSNFRLVPPVLAGHPHRRGCPTGASNNMCTMTETKKGLPPTNQLSSWPSGKDFLSALAPDVRRAGMFDQVPRALPERQGKDVSFPRVGSCPRIEDASAPSQLLESF